MRKMTAAGLVCALSLGLAAWHGRGSREALAAGREATGPQSWFVNIDGATAGSVAQTTQNQTPTSVEQTIAFTPAAMSTPFWDWVNRSVAGQDLRKNVTMVALDFDGKPSIATQLTDASVRSIVFPALNAVDRSAVKLSLTMVAPSLQPLTPQAARAGTPPRSQLLASSFRVNVDGMPTARIATVSAITVTLAPAASPASASSVAAARAASVRSGIDPKTAALAPPSAIKGAGRGNAVTVTPLVVTVAAADAPAFQSWLAAGAVKKNGSVELLSMSLKDTLVKLSLSGLAITRVATDTATSRATVEMSVDGASLSQ